MRANTSLVITRLPDGGFVVTDQYYHLGQMVTQLFASTTLEEALKYIKKNLPGVPA